ncbi:MAG: GNAT family N-acetyltransferase, partial [Armatimonadetes bacterium]|nr:GNAT family N-acetyltransferase [Armatimonadota bacterium]
MTPEGEKARRTWTATPYSMEDVPKIAQFFKRQYQGMGTYGGSDLFYWKVVNNALMPGVINLVKDGDRIASTTSVTPKRLIVGGQEIAGAEIGDTYTDANYQRQGMFLLLINQSTQDALARGVQFVYGTPNTQSLPGYEAKANYLRIPSLQLTSLSLPINVTPLLQRKANWLLATYAGAIASTGVMLASTAQRLMSPSATIEEVAELPADWDEFWQASAAAYDFILARDRRAMEWRYFSHPFSYRILVARSGGAIQGYVVYRIVHGDDLSVLSIADFLFCPGQEGLLR